MDMRIKVEETRDNHETININGYYLHSKFEPIKEAKKIAEKNYRPHHLHVIFGYGMGYILEELSRLCKFNEPILLVDPLIDKGVLQLKDYSSRRIYYISMKSLEAIENLADTLSSYTTNIIFLSSINYANILPKEALTIAKLIKDVQYKQLVNINTSNHYSMQWQLNYILNLNNIENDYSLSVLEKKYNCPVVIASSGPSLNKQLPLLKLYRDKLLLVCAGSTINALIAEGIEPDYVVSVDGGEANKKQFANVHLKYGQLIYDPMSHHDIRKHFGDKAFVFMPHIYKELKDHFREIFHRDFPIILGGGSVAHFALSIAKYITSGPICLIGQDLALTNNQSHAEGSKYIERHEQGEMQVRGYNEEKVQTNRSFNTMINTFNELQIFDPHESEIFNCTEGGAKLEQYKQCSFKKFLNDFCKERVFLENNLFEERSSKFFSLDKEFEKYYKILDYLIKGKNLAEKEPGPIFSNKAIIELGEIEKNLNILYKETCLDILLEPNIVFAEHQFLPAVNETKEQEFIRVRSYIIQLYTICLESIEEYIANLKQLLKRETEHERN